MQRFSNKTLVEEIRFVVADKCEFEKRDELKVKAFFGTFGLSSF